MRPATDRPLSPSEVRFSGDSSRLPGLLLPIAILVLLLLGFGTGYGIGASQPRQQSLARSLCEDALTRRRQAEQAIAVPPQAAGNDQAQALANVKLDETRELARGLRSAAQQEVSKYCK